MGMKMKLSSGLGPLGYVFTLLAIIYILGIGVCEIVFAHQGCHLVEAIDGGIFDVFWFVGIAPMLKAILWPFFL